MCRHRKRLSFQTACEDVALAAFEQAAERGTQLEHVRRHFPVQPLLVEHRGKKSNRRDDVSLILRRPHRHREAVDMRTPGSAGHDIAVFTQMAAVSLDAE